MSRLGADLQKVHATGKHLRWTSPSMDGMASPRRWGGGYDLVIMDMSLPEIDGWESTRRLRANPDTRSLRIIALTAHAIAGDREKALEAGCDDYDSKPVEFPRLLEKIEAQVNARTSS
jgi:CheY-like chemotaxis protein